MKINYCDYESKLKFLFKTIFKVTDKFCDMIFEKKLSKSDIFAQICDDELVAFSYAMEFLVKIKKEIKKCIYIYGVGVAEEYRGRGLSKKILNEIYEYYKDKNVSFLYLVPENEGLFKMYEKLGYKTEFYLNKTAFDLIEIKSAPYEIENGSFITDMEEYTLKRNHFEPVILRKKEDVEAIMSYTIYKKISESGFLYEADGNTALVRESFIYNEKDFYSFLSYLKDCGYEKAVVTNYPNNKIPYAMVRAYEEIDFINRYTNMNFDWFYILFTLTVEILKIMWYNRNVFLWLFNLSEVTELWAVFLV